MTSILGPALVCAVLQVMSARGESTVDASHLWLTATVVGDAPLPLQAARVRVKVDNLRLATPVEVAPLETACRMTIVKRQRSGPGEVRPLAPLALRQETHIRCEEGGRNSSAREVIEPCGSRSFTIPVGAVILDDGTREPLFPAPGAYAVRCEYVCGWRYKLDRVPGDVYATEAVSVATEVTVAVDRPGAVDEAWAAALARDPGLAAALLRPSRTCAAAQAEALRGLIAKAPESTYGNYAALALGRFYKEADGEPRPSRRVKYAMAADALALALNRDDCKGFAFRPHALLTLADVDYPFELRLKQIMGPDFPNAAEWLPVAARLLTQEQWRGLRRSAKTARP